MENMEEMNKNNAMQNKEEEKNVTELVTKDTNKKANRYILARPFIYEDKTYTEFIFDFDKLTGEDMIAIENEMAAIGEYALSPEISSSFLSKMAARAAGVGSDVIEKLPLRDFSKIKDASRRFLTDTGF